VVLEAENGQIIAGPTHAWLTSTAISGYTGTSYLHALPDTDTLLRKQRIGSGLIRCFCHCLRAFVFYSTIKQDYAKLTAR
jgi:hypothetical protein